jgi:hypothetical protein
MGFKGRVCSQLSFDALQFQVPLEVLGSRTVSHGANQITQVQVKWYELPNDLATWEDYVALKQMFPNAPGWG